MMPNNINLIEPKFDNLDQFLTADNPDGVDLLVLEQQKKQIPQRSDIVFKDNSVNNPTGLYQKAIKAERMSLYNGLVRFLDDINTKYNSTFTEDSISFVKFLPNARMAYFNKLIKTAIKSGLSQCDLKFADTVWMDMAQKEKLTTFLNVFLDNTKNGFSVQPTQSKSGMPLTCQGQNLVAKIKNPGTLVLGEDSSTACCTSCTSGSQCTAVSKTKTESMPRFTETMFKQFFREFVEENNVDKHYLHTFKPTQYHQLLSDIFIELEQSEWNLDSVSLLLNKLYDSWSVTQRKNYLYYLLNPWSNRLTQEARVPSALAFPTACCAVTAKLQLTTNALGNVAMVANPYFLSQTLSAIGVNNDATLTGAASSNLFNSVSTDLLIPGPLFSQYRLVSSAIKVDYLGADLNNAGKIVVALLPASTTVVATVPGAPIASYAAFGQFNRIDNGYFSETMPCTKDRSLNCIWYSPDDGIRTMQYLGNGHTSNLFGVYIKGAQASSVVAEVELICNFEAEVDPTYNDWIGKQIPKSSFADYEHARNKVSSIISSGMSMSQIIDNASPLAVDGGDDRAMSGITPAYHKPGKLKGDKDKDITLLDKFLAWMKRKAPGFILDLSKAVMAPELSAAEKLLSLLSQLAIKQSP